MCWSRVLLVGKLCYDLITYVAVLGTLGIMIVSEACNTHILSLDVSINILNRECGICLPLEMRILMKDSIQSFVPDLLTISTTYSDIMQH